MDTPLLMREFFLWYSGLQAGYFELGLQTEVGSDGEPKPDLSRFKDFVLTVRLDAATPPVNTPGVYRQVFVYGVYYDGQLSEEPVTSFRVYAA
jgi:hypothetical protein